MAIVTATIKNGTEEMKGTYELLSIDVSKEFNKVPTAELRLVDGNIPTNEFNILDDVFFDLGEKIEIALRYEGKSAQNTTVFIGLVVNKSLELNKFGTVLTIALSDEAIRMTTVRKNEVYRDKKDSVIIEKHIEQNGLKGTMDDTKVTHAQMIQYYTTDWDFMVSRAEANGQLVMASNGEIAVFQPAIQDFSTQANPILQLELGKDEIYDFDLKINGSNQYHQVNAVAWDSTQQALTDPAKGEDYKIVQGNHDIAKIATVMGAKETTLINPAAMDTKELKAWSTAKILKSRLSFFRGWFKIPGIPNVLVGDTIAIKGMGDTFAGKNIISGVRHEVTPEGWITHLQIGMDSCWFSAQPNVMDTKAAGLLPGVNGLQIGIVQAYKEDPSHQSRVQVVIPALGQGKDTLWARLATIDAGAARGVFFRPEPGDEVIIGFLNDDPRQAIILGATHSSVNKVPIPFNKENSQKGIFTKLKYQLLFDEEKEVITLSTSEKNQIAIDEKQNMIKMSDANGNQVELSKNGVMIISAKHCEINTKGNLAIEAKGNVSIKGSKVDLI